MPAGHLSILRDNSAHFIVGSSVSHIGGCDVWLPTWAPTDVSPLDNFVAPLAWLHQIPEAMLMDYRIPRKTSKQNPPHQIFFSRIASARPGKPLPRNATCYFSRFNGQSGDSAPDKINAVPIIRRPHYYGET